jgi:hypothetical protein
MSCHLCPSSTHHVRVRIRRACSRYSAAAVFLVFLCAVASPLRAQNLERIGSAEGVHLGGTISAGLAFYGVDGRPATREATSWIIRGNPTLQLYGMTLPFSFTLTEQSRDFRQPLNRFGASPYYRWATFHMGYRSLTWSRYTLAGHSMLGAGVELAPGPVRVGFFSGRLSRAIEPDSTAGAGVIQAVYKRTGYAMRIGAGDKDRQASLVVLHGKDDAGSLNITASGATALPEENLVVGLVAHAMIVPRLSLDFEWARSAYTDNTESAGEGDYEGALLKLFGFLMDHRRTTREANAIDGALAWKDAWGDVKLRFERIDPGYRSMGAYYFNNDLQKITIEPTVSVFGRKLRAAASLGLQHDNLSDNKDVQTNRVVGSARVDWMPLPQYTAGVSYSNYSIDQKAGRSPLDSTSTKISQATNNVGVTQTLSLVRERTAHNISLVWSLQDMQDKTENGVIDQSYTSSQLNAVYMFTWVPWGVGLTGGFNRSVFDVTSGKTKVVGPLFGANVALWRHRVTLGATVTLSTTSVGGTDTNDTNTFQVVASLKQGRRHRVTARFYVHDNNAKTAGATSYTETRGEVSYAVVF